MCKAAKTIVVAEDDALIRMLAADRFAEAGYDIIEVQNATDALHALGRGDVHLLFTDVNMPGVMDGLDLARLVHQKWPRIHVILASADERVAGNGCCELGKVFHKPYHMARVLEHVGTLNAD